MFNVQGKFDKRAKDMDGCIPTGSLLRFPAYAALADGAEGIWYFCYNAGSLQHLGPHQTDEAAQRARTVLWPVAQRVNRRTASWGSLLFGRTCASIFGTAFRPRTARLSLRMRPLMARPRTWPNHPQASWSWPWTRT